MSGVAYALAFILFGTAVAAARGEPVTWAGFFDSFRAVGPGVLVAGWIASYVLGWPAITFLRPRGLATWQFLVLGVIGGILLSRLFWPRTPLLIVSTLSGICAAGAARAWLGTGASE